MSVIDDLKVAVGKYSTNDVATEIVNFTLVPDVGGALNKNEKFKFRIKVTNQGHLHMKGVKVEALGTDFADVSEAENGTFDGSASPATFNLNAHSENTTPFLFGRAKKVTGDTAKDIVLARIAAWDANLDDILIGHSVSGDKEGVLKKVILPD